MKCTFYYTTDFRKLDIKLVDYPFNNHYGFGAIGGEMAIAYESLCIMCIMYRPIILLQS